MMKVLLSIGSLICAVGYARLGFKQKKTVTVLTGLGYLICSVLFVVLAIQEGELEIKIEKTKNEG